MEIGSSDAQSLTCECPLCGTSNAGVKSWMGSTVYSNRRFDYLECCECRSLYIYPMPDEEYLSNLYDSSYGAIHSRSEDDQRRDLSFVLNILSARRPGFFVDYGCNDGSLALAIREAGWSVGGVELNAEVAEVVSRRTGISVLTPDQALKEWDGAIDILHLGDVIEHLRDPVKTLRSLESMLNPNGLIIAQGPLEANKCIFTLALKYSRIAKGNRDSAMPPYHLILATARGQQEFFRRLGLNNLDFTISEANWPAPAKFPWPLAGNFRGAGMYALRKISQLTSSNLRNWGNRYSYFGSVSSRIDDRISHEE